MPSGFSNRGFCLYVVVAFFAGMGVASLASPLFTLHFFGMKTLPADMKNEVRAVYGGFGLAVAGVLHHTRLVERRRPGYAMGIRTAVMVALIGMAGGRIVSFAVDATDGPYPATFLGLELGLAFLLHMAMPESGFL